MKIKRTHMAHVQIISLGYFVMIAIGTLLLMLPISTRTGNCASFTDAFFTATSASCVTGLILQDTATYWSRFGQTVIIVLIQIGGLGFMTIATFFFLFLRKRVGLRSRAIMVESINSERIGGVIILTKKILIGTLIFEGSGAIVLSIRFMRDMSVGRAIYYGVFHSISAFCNAGFDLMGVYEKYSSFTRYAGDITVNVTIMLLIITGGIGFLVWDDIYKNKLHFKKYKLHTKIVLSSTAILVFGSAVLFYIFEDNNLSAGLSQSEKILTALFNSVTARTAGFNTTDTANLTTGSKLLTIILMFIGGSPGSTAGGVKTATIVMLIVFALTYMTKRQYASIFDRRLDDGLLKKAVSVFCFNLFLSLLGVFVIVGVQTNIPLEDAMFESFSAMGTVGITTGITRSLSMVSKYTIIFLMYCGRIGSVSFATALLERKARPPVMPPVEDITIG